jgi:hypothetical protein
MSSADHSRFPPREPAAILFPFEHHVVSIIYLSMQLCILTYFAFRLGPTSRKSVFGSVRLEGTDLFRVMFADRDFCPATLFAALYVLI